MAPRVALAWPLRVDAASETGFAGLQKKWESAFKDSGISASEASANPGAVLDALNCFMEGPTPQPQVGAHQPLALGAPG